MLEWIIKKTKTYKDLEEDVYNYCEEMQKKQTKIINLRHDCEILRNRNVEAEKITNEIMEEKQNIINDLMNKLELKEKQRKSASGKIGILNKKIKKLENDIKDLEEKNNWLRSKI